MMHNRAFLEALLAILTNRDRKAAFLDLCDLYVTGTDEQRAFVRKHYPFSEKWETPYITEPTEIDDRNGCSDRWPFYCDLPSDLPDEAPAVQRIRAVLIWLSIAGGSGDLRDDGLALGLVYFAAEDAGMDTKALFAEVAALSGQEPVTERPYSMLREQMGYWLRKYSENGMTFTLEQMGFTRLKTPYGIRFSPIEQ
jgi:hypothetical protein